MFEPRTETLEPFEILKWWEKRRLPYNLIVGMTGLLTCFIAGIVATISYKIFDEPLGIPDPPFIAVFGVILFGIAANVCFTGGWIAEILAFKLWNEKAAHFGQIAFTLGLGFSVLLTLAPAADFTLILILRLIFRW
jgi:xanthosine utilization system XapX-like protein